MLKTGLLPAIAASVSIVAVAAYGADFSDPSWPCVQRKVERLSPALMWQYPLPETKAGSAVEADIRELADTLALRRIEPDSLRPEVEAFSKAHDGAPDILGRVFSRAFDRLDRRRTRIIQGIGDFSLGQIRLSEQIDAARLEMDQLLAEEAPDFDRIDALEEKIDWDQLIFSDRNQSITYLCETPQLIERRLFAIAQLLASVVEDPG